MQIYTCFRKMQDRLHRERYAFLFNSSSAVIDYCFSWKNSYLVCNFCIFQCWPTCRVYYSVWIIRLHENNEKQKKKKKWKQVGGQRKSMLDRNKQAKPTTNKQEKKIVFTFYETWKTLPELCTYLLREATTIIKSTLTSRCAIHLKECQTTPKSNCKF